ncbi:ABC transporter ATP-binding protein/permease [Pseudomonas asplenii]|uniref:ABC transporter ATP-binding protein/permease n=1 Tax=Pseudomonas asplenii TaxID=53407 RepID=UPI0037C60AE4
MAAFIFPISKEREFLSFSRRAWELIHPYWHSQEWFKAWALLLAILGLSFAGISMAVAYNHWHRDIYNVLESRNAPEFGRLLIVFIGIAAASIFMSVYSTYLTKILLVRWRRWLFYGYSDAWLKNNRHYRLQIQESIDNPDQRLTEDIEAFSRLTLQTVLGLVQTLTSLVTFSVIMWTVSGSLEILGVNVPGYMFWAAVIYSLIGSLITHYIGRRLIGLNNAQQRVEADLRFDLIRIRENGESIALQGGEPGEQSRLRMRFGEVWQNFHNLVRSEKKLMFFVGGYSQFSFVFPLAVAGPRLFSGTLQFGELMQLTQAFGSLQSSLSWFVSVYHDLVEWRAVTDRLLGFDRALTAVITAPCAIKYSPSTSGSFHLEGIETWKPDGTSLLKLNHLFVSPGQHVLVQGPSGSGKSTLFRTVAGIWKYGRGAVYVSSEVYVIPQRPYFPVGKLRQALEYPATDLTQRGDEIQLILDACRLEHLKDHLDTDAHWEKRLSPGEQQRLAIARALLAKPKFLLLDEVSSALSLDDEERMYSLIKSQLSLSTVISIGHRSSLAAYHDLLWSVDIDGNLIQQSIKNFAY